MAGGIVKGIGSIFGKKKKKKPAAPAAPVAASKSESSGKSKGKSSQLSSGLTSKADVKAEALAALKSYQETNKATAQTHQDLVKKLAAVVQPSVAKMQADVAQAALQKKVTSEHNRKVKEEERWKANELAHLQIMSKFDALEKSLLGSHDTTKRVFKIYGVNT
jgi:flagellar biosynthesis GTPase FlhF